MTEGIGGRILARCVAGYSPFPSRLFPHQLKPRARLIRTRRQTVKVDLHDARQVRGGLKKHRRSEFAAQRRGSIGIRQTVDVVFPTPPFWFAKAMMVVIPFHPDGHSAVFSTVSEKFMIAT